MIPPEQKRRRSPLASILLALILGAGIFFAWSFLREKAVPSEVTPSPLPAAIAPAAESVKPLSSIPPSPEPLPPVNPIPFELSNPTVEEPQFRLSSMAGGWGNDNSIGIVDRKTGQGSSLKVGDQIPGGWKLIAIDFDQETARFENKGKIFVATLEEGVPVLQPSSSPSSQTATTATPPTPSTEPQEMEEVNLSIPFSNRLFRTEDGNEVSVRRVERSPKVVELQTEGKRFAIRRSIAERVLSIGNLSADDRLWMMVSYPGLVELLPGEDAAEQSNLAEEQLAEMLTPPTNKPPIEELNRLLENFVEPLPPPP